MLSWLENLELKRGICHGTSCPGYPLPGYHPGLAGGPHWVPPHTTLLSGTQSDRSISPQRSLVLDRSPPQRCDPSKINGSPTKYVLKNSPWHPFFLVLARFYTSHTGYWLSMTSSLPNSPAAASATKSPPKSPVAANTTESLPESPVPAEGNPDDAALVSVPDQ